jgi:acyl-CoA reductase-like NAD-dependent aldehyde dehydrogenase
MTPQQRADVLDAVGSEVLARKTELGDLLAREEGKALPDAGRGRARLWRKRRGPGRYLAVG